MATSATRVETIWRNCIFGFCGVTNVTRRSFGVITGSTAAQRELWLAEAAAIAVAAFAGGA